MKTPTEYPDFDDVCSDIGDKVVSAMSASVGRTRQDLARYREALPQFVADASERGLANWIHDRLWVNVTTDLNDVSEVTIVDDGVLREIICGINYRFRAKRHDEESNVRSYPTQRALDFHVQQITFDGLAELKLDFGYEWSTDERKIGPAVMSLRDGRKIIWSNVIHDDEGISAETLAGGTGPAHSPSINVRNAGSEQKKEDGSN